MSHRRFTRSDKKSRRDYVPFSELPASHFGSADHLSFLQEQYSRQINFIDEALSKANTYLGTLDQFEDEQEIRQRQNRIDRIEAIQPHLHEIQSLLH